LSISAVTSPTLAVHIGKENGPTRARGGAAAVATTARPHAAP
jgi:hypothetical protein